MVSINLSRSDQQHAGSKSAPLVGISFLVSIGLLVFVAVVYGGLLSYNKLVDSQMANQRTALDEYKTTMNTPAAIMVADFARRSEETTQHLDAVVIPTDTLDKLEKAVLPTVVLADYKRLSDGSITLTLTAPSVKDIAQQLLSFKTSFGLVASGKIALSQDGTFQSAVTMTDTLAVK